MGSISARTSIRTIPATFRLVKEKFGGWELFSRNADIGGGKYDDFTQALLREGVANYVYDPYNRSYAHNEYVSSLLRKNDFDTVTVNNVLNVIPDFYERIEVIRLAAHSVKPDGTVYFLIYKAPKVSATQNAMPVSAYVPEIQAYFQDVTTYRNLIIAKGLKGITIMEEG